MSKKRKHGKQVPRSKKQMQRQHKRNAQLAKKAKRKEEYALIREAEEARQMAAKMEADRLRKKAIHDARKREQARQKIIKAWKAKGLLRRLFLTLIGRRPKEITS